MQLINMNILFQLLKSKHDLSNKHYQERFTTETPDKFLYYFDMMNVYTLFPTPIDIDIQPSNITLKELTLAITNDDKQEQKIEEELNIIKKQINHKIHEIKKIPKEILEKRSKPSIRKLFSYEIVDNIKNNYNGEHVTIAWLKCYEIITYYNLIPKTETINYFGICEQPGAFVYAINHYIKTKQPNSQFKFVIESLIDKTNKKIFKPDPNLFNKYKDHYDYGKDGTGDVTKIENIKYHRTKYLDRHFDLISADCGQDASMDFTKQEDMIIKVIIGQFLLAISLSGKGSNYFFKLFTMYNHVSHHLLFIATCLFKKVSICRTLTTKPTSGENYCICKDFKYDKKDPKLQELLNKLYAWFLNKEHHSLVKSSTISYTFYDSLLKCNVFLSTRRILSNNFILFRINNNEYAKDKEIVHKYIKQTAEHYNKYFIDYYGVEYLNEENKLV